jgi:hypothetical protein
MTPGKPARALVVGAGLPRLAYNPPHSSLPAMSCNRQKIHFLRELIPRSSASPAATTAAAR